MTAITRGSAGRIDGRAGFADRLDAVLQQRLGPVVLLVIRLAMARIFIAAGLTRLAHWEAQGYLFSAVHPVPLLAPAIAAPLTTGLELGLGALLALGLFGRLAALGMLGMTMVIQFIVAATPQGTANAIGNPQHYLWMLVLAVIIAFGPGSLSVDRLLFRRRPPRP